MAKLDKQGLNTFIRELDKHINTKINRLDISPTAEKVIMANGSTVETTVTTNKSNISILQSNVNNNTNEIQSLKQSVSNGKTLIASAITDKKVPTSNTDSFQTMANNIAKIEVPRLPKWVTGIKFECSKMSQNILNSTSNLIDDKIILIAGERPSNGGKSDVVRLFDPVDNSWIDLPSFPVTTYGHSSVVVNGKVYAGGGNNSKDALYCFDYSKNTWSVASNIPNQRTYLSMASIGDNIYCIGGSDTNYNECYNVNTNTWTTKKTITKARSGGLCFALDNKVYVLGGKNGTTVLDKHECYDPVTDTWSDKTNFKICDAKGDVYNGCFYVIGGERSTSYSGAVSKYDPTTDTWGSLTGFGRGTEEHTSTFAGNCLYTFGGMATGSTSAEIRADGYLI